MSSSTGLMPIWPEAVGIIAKLTALARGAIVIVARGSAVTADACAEATKAASQRGCKIWTMIETTVWILFRNTYEFKETRSMYVWKN